MLKMTWAKLNLNHKVKSLILLVNLLGRQMRMPAVIIRAKSLSKVCQSHITLSQSSIRDRSQVLMLIKFLRKRQESVNFLSSLLNKSWLSRKIKSKLALEWLYKTLLINREMYWPLANHSEDMELKCKFFLQQAPRKRFKSSTKAVDK